MARLICIWPDLEIEEYENLENMGFAKSDDYLIVDIDMDPPANLPMDHYLAIADYSHNVLGLN